MTILNSNGQPIPEENKQPATEENHQTIPPEEQQPRNPGGRQSFSKFGLIEAINGNIVLRGRHGERDHIYPLEKALEKYFNTQAVIGKMVKYGFRNWDELMDINKDFKFVILECCKQRRSLGIEIPEMVKLFAQQHEGDPVINVKKD